MAALPFRTFDDLPKAEVPTVSVKVRRTTVYGIAALEEVTRAVRQGHLTGCLMIDYLHGRPARVRWEQTVDDRSS